MLDSVHPKVCKKVGATWPRETSISGQAPLQPECGVQGEPGGEAVGAEWGGRGWHLDLFLGAARGQP